MSKKFIKNKDEDQYNEVIFDKKRAGKDARDIRQKKSPTSVALDPETIIELKKMAEKKGIPYQVLMRSFIVEGLERAKKLA